MTKQTTIQFNGKRSPVHIPEDLRLAGQRRSKRLGMVSFSEYIRYLILMDLQKEVRK